MLLQAGGGRSVAGGALRALSTARPVWADNEDEGKKSGKISKKETEAEAAEAQSRLAKMWVATKKMAHHHWTGFKMLGTETRIASKYLIKLVRGNQLTRRERRQLRRTAADLFRVIPLAMFLVVPFLELLLPVALYIFPNMLPSTFEDEAKVKEKRRKELKIRLEMAKFLKEILHEVADETKLKSGEARAEELTSFMGKVQAGEPVDNESILRMANLFGDKLTLSTLTRPQLQNMCKYMGISPYGTTGYLRFQLENRFETIKQDDLMIMDEGVDSLSDEELVQAAISRGMRGVGVDLDKLRAQISEWLYLHIEEQVPAAMLVLSRALLISEKVAPAVRLQDTILAFPEEIIDEIRAEEVDTEDDDDTAAEKLRLLKIEEEAIAREAAKAKELKDKEDAAKQAARQAEEDAAVKTAIQEDTIRTKSLADATMAATAAATVASATATVIAAEAKRAAAARGEDVGDDDAAARPGAEPLERMHDVVTALSSEELQQLEEAVVTLASDSALEKEKEALEALKASEEKDAAAAEAEAQSAAAAAAAAAVSKDKRVVAETKLLSSLERKIAKMVSSLEEDIHDAESELGASLKTIDIDGDGCISAAEFALAVSSMKHKLTEKQLDDLWAKIDLDNDDRISIDELTNYVVEQAELAQLAREAALKKRTPSTSSSPAADADKE